VRNPRERFAAHTDVPFVASGWTPFLAVVAVHAMVTSFNITLPGVYMDAVTPDYLVVKVLNPHHQPIIAWLLDGNYLFGRRAPWMVSLYHGSQTFWLGLPFYWLLGTTVEGLRITHAVFALGVLGGLYYLLRCCRLSSVICAATCMALAIDPSFSFAFRSQSYITLAPSAWLLASVALLVGTPVTGTRRWLTSGALAGLAATGYFVQGFFLAALLPAAWLASRRETPWPGRTSARWMAGLALGLLPVVIGYVLLMNAVGGPGELITYLQKQQSALGAFSSNLTMVERLAYAWSMLTGVVGNTWNHTMLFGEPVAVPGSNAKIFCLLILPTALWLASELRRTATAEGRLLAAMPGAFVAAALVFGGRLAGHHYVVVVPWLYAGLVVSLRDVTRGLSPPSLMRAGTIVLVIAAVALNAAGQFGESRVLVRTGGAGLMSDAINRYAADLNALDRKPFVYFPDWGLAMPIAFLTAGTVGMDSIENYAQARALLCEGRDVEVALIHDRDAGRQRWSRHLRWDEPAVTRYRQLDGKVVFDRVRFRGHKEDDRCR
jgi:hypothetical protein